MSKYIEADLADTNFDDIEENKNSNDIKPNSSNRNRQVLIEQMKMLKNQDAHLDDLGKISGQMKENNKLISEELHNQSLIIANLDKQISKTTNGFKKADLKLRRLIQSSSRFYLWLIIIFEIF
mmetsp:Transcript_17885/g.15795  ORF Transcript_17885/g.15795 Transcript_17885/m.15795 type:complete len:123 (+) Transcript_17885:24-392(+)